MTTHETIFCSRPFVDTWCYHLGGEPQPLTVSADGGRASEEVFAVSTTGRLGLRSVRFAPEGFYGSPGWQGQLGRATIQQLLAQLQASRVREFVWNVRFDHEPLARQLAGALPAAQRPTTQVLKLQTDYGESFRNFNATIRNQVRKARKSGVVVRASQCKRDLEAYYSIHLQHVAAKGGFDFVFPQAFLQRLVEEPISSRLLVAEVDEVIAAGGIFLRDGDSIYYFHGAYDHRFSKLFPACAVIDEAIRWAHEVGATTFNFGGSGGIESLERFKSFWGAERVRTWRFTWQNPRWKKLEGAKQWIKNWARRS